MRSIAWPTHPALRIGLAWLLPVAACLVQWIFLEQLGSSPYFLVYPVVFLAPHIGGRIGGIGATLIAALLVWYLFLPPHLSWALAADGAPISLLVFAITGIVFTVFHQHLRDRDTRYRTLFDKAADGIALLDADGRFLDVNPAYCAMAGQPRASIVGAKVEDVVDVQTVQSWQATNDQVQNGGMANLERRVRRPDGGVIDVEVAVAPLAAGRRMAIVRDVSERKRMEDALRKSEHRFALIFHAAPLPLSVSTLESGRYLDVNDAFVRQFGYTRDELIGRTSVETGMLSPVARQAKLEEMRRKGRLHNSQIVFTGKSGAAKECLLSSEVIDLPGEPILLTSVADISELVQAQQELRTSEERFRLVFQNSPNGIAVWDGAGNLRYSSPATNGWFAAGFTGDDENSRRAREAITWCAQHPGERVQIDAGVLLPGSERHDLQITFQGFRRGSCDSEVVSISHDVTAHRTLERLLEQANDALEQQLAELQRTVAAKDAFMAAVSHELRTPLTGVLIMSELLQSETRGPLNPSQAKYVGAIQEHGERLMATVNDVLLYTGLMAGSRIIQRETFLLPDLLDSAAGTVQADAERKQQQLTRVYEPPDLLIESDPQAISEIVKVLLGNAVKFTPAQGKIHLQATAGEAIPGTETVRIIVSDTGVGMNEELVSRLFEPFMQGDQTLERQYEGLGLGLAFVRKMVELIGGSINVESAPGRGSRFTVTLPLRMPE